MQTYRRQDGDIPLFEYWVKGTLANFGWLDAHFSNTVYFVLAAAIVLVALLAVTALVRLRSRVDLWLLAFFAVAVLTLLAGVHWTDYRQLEGGAVAFVQGRYVLPLAGLAGLLVALALRGLPQRGRAIGAALALSGLFTLTLFSLALTLDRFYA